MPDPPTMVRGDRATGCGARAMGAAGAAQSGRAGAKTSAEAEPIINETHDARIKISSTSGINMIASVTPVSQSHYICYTANY